MSPTSNAAAEANHVEAPKLHEDRPINGDHANPDRLDRLRFAERIACGLKDVPLTAALVISIEGTWGTGKTSVFNLVKRAFCEWPESQRPIVVNFQPWLVGRAEQLAQAFIVQLAAAIELQDRAGAGAKAAKQLLAYSKIFDVLRLVPGSEPWATLVKQVVEAVGGAVEKVSNLKALDLDRRRNAVVEALADLDRRIVVFVDDLDRLPPHEVTEMVRLIKAVGDFPGLAYLVAFDSKYVEKALSQQGIPESGTYLDKIVQIRLHVPDADSERLMVLVDEEYERLPEAARTALPKTHERVQEVFYHGLRDFIETPRDIKRLFNRIYFLEPACRGEVSLGDLLALEALALKAPEVYRHLRDDPEAYVGRPLYETLVPPDREKIVQQNAGARAALITDLPHGLRLPAQRLLSCLFPLTAESGWDREPGTSALGLIQAPDRLAIALSVGLPSREASLSDAYKLARSPEIRESILNDALARGRFTRLVDHLNNLEKEPIPDLPGLAVALGQALDSPHAIDAELNQESDLSYKPSRIIWEFLRDQLDSTEAESTYSVVLALVRHRACISLSTKTLVELRQRIEGNAYREPKLWASKEEWPNLLKHWRENVQTWLTAGEINRLAQAERVLQCFWEWCPDEAKSVIESYLVSDYGADRLMLSFRDNGVDSVKGRFIELSSDQLEPFGEIGRLKEIARRRLADTNLPLRLKVVYTAIMSGRKVYAADASFAAFPFATKADSIEQGST